MTTTALWDLRLLVRPLDDTMSKSTGELTGKLTGFVTGIGSVPDMPTSTAAHWVLENFPELGYLAEIPSRGPWSSMVGRAGALTAGLFWELTAHGWRTVPHPGADQRRIAAAFNGDVDALIEARAETSTPVKTQVVGPWTLAANAETTLSKKALQDSGACRDIAQSLAQGIAEHVDHLRRAGHHNVVVQIDEPSIAGIRRGAGSSLFSQPRIPQDEEIVRNWAIISDRLDAPVVLHSCAPEIPWALAGGFDGISIDGAYAHDEDGLGQWLDRGKALWWGALPVSADPLAPVSTTVTTVRNLLRNLGFSDRISDRIALTPACGLSGLTRTEAQLLVRRLNETMDALVQEV